MELRTPRRIGDAPVMRSEPRSDAAQRPLSNPTPRAGQVILKKRRIYALQGERQCRDDRHVIGASPRRYWTPWCEPVSEHGPGIVGDIGERREPHPV